MTTDSTNNLFDYLRATVPVALVSSVVLFAGGLLLSYWNNVEIRRLRDIGIQQVRDEIADELDKMSGKIDSAIARQGMIYEWLLKAYEERVRQEADGEK